MNQVSIEACQYLQDGGTSIRMQHHYPLVKNAFHTVQHSTFLQWKDYLCIQVSARKSLKKFLKGCSHLKQITLCLSLILKYTQTPLIQAVWDSLGLGTACNSETVISGNIPYIHKCLWVLFNLKFP